MTEFSKSIVANADDGYQYSTSIDSGQTYCSFGQEGSYTFNSYFRFTNVTIPQGATITSAIIRFYASHSRSETTVNVRIRCEDADNAAQISSYADYAGRAITDAYTDWSPAAWTAGSSYDSADFTSAVQEVVNRASWASDNALQIFVRDNSSSASARRYAASLENASYAEPQLIINYTSPVEADLTDVSGLGDTVDGFSLTDTIADAAGLGDSVDAYNTDEVMSESIALDDTVAGEAEIEVSLSDAAGLGDAIDAGFEAEGALTDAAGLGDSSDGFNWTAWLASNRDLAVVRYYCTLTGAADGLADVTLPISSFQARKRTDQRDYLSVVVPGIAYADAIASRSNGEIYIEMAYLLDGVESVREEIIRADLETINVSEGTQSRSISLSGYGDGTMPARAASIQGSNYKATYSGSLSFRFPQADPYLNPGDALTVLDTGDSLTVDQITYAISARGAKFMEVREA